MSAEMWTLFEQYQPYADAAGYGESWRKMTQERTQESMQVAYADASGDAAYAADAAWAAEYAARADAAAYAADAAWTAADAAWYEARAIECIKRAIKEAQS